MVYFMYLVKG